MEQELSDQNEYLKTEPGKNAGGAKRVIIFVSAVILLGTAAWYVWVKNECSKIPPGIYSIDLFNPSGIKFLSCIKELDTLNIREHGGSITSLHFLKDYPRLKRLSVENCQTLSNLSGIENLKQLRTLRLSRLPGIKDLSLIGSLPQLTSLTLSGLDNIEDLSGIAALHNLTSLDIAYCKGLLTISGIENLKELQSLSLSVLDSVHDLSMLGSLSKLNSLYLNAISPTDIIWLEKLTQLTSLNLRLITTKEDLNSKNFFKIPDLSGFKDLQILTFNFVDIKSLGGIEKLQSLRSLFIDCASIDNYTLLQRLPKLTRLSVTCHRDCSDFSFITKIPQLTSLELKGFKSNSLIPLKALPQLRSLSLSGFDNLKDLSILTTSPALDTLTLAHNHGIVNFDILSQLSHLKALNITYNNWNPDQDNNSKKSNSMLRGFLAHNSLNQISSLEIAIDTLENLSGITSLTNLRTLKIRPGRLKDLSGIERLQKLDTLVLQIFCDPPDLYLLKRLKNLKTLECPYSDALKGEIEEIQKALPGCSINQFYTCASDYKAF